MRDSQATERVPAPWREWGRAGAAVLALAAPAVGSAGQAGASFTVKVDLLKHVQIASFNGASEMSGGSIASNAASGHVTGEPATGGRAYRFMLRSGSDGPRYASVDLYAGAGTLASWRIVRLTDWDYLEMTVGW